MAEYYTLVTVRDQILQRGVVGYVSVLGTFPSDWFYCPCIIIEKCAKLNNKVCSVPLQLGIFFNDPNIGLSIIEIIYKRETREGFVRTNHMKLNQLIEKGIIDIKALEIVTF
jgi:hypothetical protein